MRSSKSRSRSKNNRNRPSGGNVVNRVFDSSGPEGKVRGTPQQVIEKYNQLARDAQLAGDRVATENFQQHAEHYTRLLAQAQREMDARRDQHGGQAQQGAQGNGGQQNGANGHGGGQPQHQPQAEARARDDASRGGRGPRFRNGEGADDPRGEADGPDESGLVETPEAAAAAQPEPEPAPAGAEDEAPARPPARARARAGGARTRTRAKAPKAEEGETPEGAQQAAGG